MSSSIKSTLMLLVVHVRCILLGHGIPVEGYQLNFSTGCPLDGASKDGYCYLMIHSAQAIQWDYGSYLCGSFGAVLLYWNDIDELNFAMYNLKSLTTGDKIWTGLKHTYGIWSWDDKQTSLDESDLTSIVPGFNNWSPVRTFSEQYVYVIYDDLFDHSSSGLSNFFYAVDVHYLVCRSRQVGRVYSEALYYYTFDNPWSNQVFDVIAGNLQYGYLGYSTQRYYDEKRGNSIGNVSPQLTLGLYSDDCIKCPGMCGGFTLAFWLYLPDKPDTSDNYFNAGNEGTSCGIEINYNAFYEDLEFIITYETQTTLLLPLDPAVTLGQWTHIIVTHSSNSGTDIYVDKIPQTVTGYGLLLWTDTIDQDTSIRIGSEGPARFDELAFWDKVLDSTERDSIYADDDFEYSVTNEASEELTSTQFVMTEETTQRKTTKVEYTSQGSGSATQLATTTTTSPRDPTTNSADELTESTTIPLSGSTAYSASTAEGSTNKGILTRIRSTISPETTYDRSVYSLPATVGGPTTLMDWSTAIFETITTQELSDIDTSSSQPAAASTTHQPTSAKSSPLVSTSTELFSSQQSEQLDSTATGPQTKGTFDLTTASQMILDLKSQPNPVSSSPANQVVTPVPHLSSAGGSGSSSSNQRTPSAISTASSQLIMSELEATTSETIAQLFNLLNSTVSNGSPDSHTAALLFNSTAVLADYSLADEDGSKILAASAQVYIELASLLVKSFSNYTVEEAINVVVASLSVVNNLVNPANAKSWESVGQGLVAEITKTAELMAVNLALRASNQTMGSIILESEYLVTVIDFIEETEMSVQYTFPRNASDVDGATFSIPTAVFEAHEAKAVVTLLYHTLGPLLQGSDEDDGSKDHHDNVDEDVSESVNEKENSVVGSKILTVTLVPTLESSVSDAINFGFQIHPDSWASLRKIETMKKCAYWNFSLSNETNGAWSDSGCRITSQNDTFATCSCNHMTSFAILIQVVDIEISDADKQALDIISLVGCVFSIIGTFMTCATYLFLRMTSERTIIHFNLSLAIMLAQVIFLFEETTEKNTVGCTVVVILLYFFNIAIFCWMMIEGVQIYLQVVVVFVNAERLKMYIIIGWGLPLIFTVITVAVLRESLGMHGVCWLSIVDNSIWFFIGPATVVILINYYILIRVTKVIVSLTTAHGANKVEHAKKSIRASVMLLPLLGCTWAFGFLCVSGTTIVFHYLFAICNSFQGFCLFLAYCAFSSEVRESWQKKRESWTLERSLNTRRTSKVSPASTAPAWTAQGDSSVRSTYVTNNNNDNN